MSLYANIHSAIIANRVLQEKSEKLNDQCTLRNVHFYITSFY